MTATLRHGTSPGKLHIGISIPNNGTFMISSSIAGDDVRVRPMGEFAVVWEIELSDPLRGVRFACERLGKHRAHRELAIFGCGWHEAVKVLCEYAAMEESEAPPEDSVDALGARPDAAATPAGAHVEHERLAQSACTDDARACLREGERLLSEGGVQRLAEARALLSRAAESDQLAAWGLLACAHHAQGNTGPAARAADVYLTRAQRHPVPAWTPLEARAAGALLGCISDGSGLRRSRGFVLLAERLERWCVVEPFEWAPVVRAAARTVRAGSIERSAAQKSSDELLAAVEWVDQVFRRPALKKSRLPKEESDGEVWSYWTSAQVKVVPPRAERALRAHIEAGSLAARFVLGTLLTYARPTEAVVLLQRPAAIGDFRSWMQLKQALWRVGCRRSMYKALLIGLERTVMRLTAASARQLHPEWGEHELELEVLMEGLVDIHREWEQPWLARVPLRSEVGIQLGRLMWTHPEVAEDLKSRMVDRGDFARWLERLAETSLTERA